MPSRAFVPVALTEAQPRVYKSFRGRQIRGLAGATAGVGLVLWIFGAGDLIGYALAFAAALPGFAYGYYHPQGKPVEYWLKVVFHYYTAPQMITAHPLGRRPRWRRLGHDFGSIIIRAAQFDPIINWRLENGPRWPRAAQIKPEPFSPVRRQTGEERRAIGR